MKKALFLVVSAFLTVLAIALDRETSKDKFAGFYQGEAIGAKAYPIMQAPEVYAEVFRGENAQYRLKVLSGIMSRSEEHALAEGLKADGDKIVLKNAGMPDCDITAINGEITPEKIDFTADYKGKKVQFKFTRMNIVSPTMGAKAPEGAIVLFDGKDTSRWTLKDGAPLNWEVKDGAMTIKTDAKDAKGKRLASTAVSKDAFGACRMHLEFKEPLDYGKPGQGKGNSGVIFGGIYEVQVLDSFGSPAYWNECGSIYRQVPPQVNACLEAGAWQTYDICYTPAKYEGDKLVEKPKFTVYLNGVRVQSDTTVEYATHLSPSKGKEFKDFARGPVNIHLQDHTNPLSYRNIWVQPIQK